MSKLRAPTQRGRENRRVLLESEAAERRKGWREGGRKKHSPKHDALVTGANVLHVPGAGVDGLGDIGGLLLDGHDDVHGVVVQALPGVIVPDLLDRVTDHLEGRAGKEGEEEGGVSRALVWCKRISQTRRKRGNMGKGLSQREWIGR